MATVKEQYNSNKKSKEEKEFRIRNVTYQNEFTLDDFLRKKVNIIVNKYK